MKELALVLVLAAGSAFAGYERTIELKEFNGAADGGSVANLAISAFPSDCDLYVATGMTDGGAMPEDWDHATFVATVPAFDTSVSCILPTGFQKDYTHFRFFVLYDEVKDYSSYLVDSITSQNADLHIDTGVLINGGNINLTRVSITMSAPNGLWPVNGISNPQPVFFCGPCGPNNGGSGQIFYGSGTANVETSGYYPWGHKATFDLDFLNQTFKVTDWSTEPETELLNLASLTRSGATAANTFWIFGYNTERAQRAMTIYSADFWQNGEPVASIVPAVSNGVVCAYDFVRERYLLPMDKFDTTVMTNLVAGAKLFPAPSSSETFSALGFSDPMLDPVSATAEGLSARLSGTLVSCGFGHSTCDLYVRAGLDPDALGEAVCVTNDVSSGNFSLVLSGLLPRRHYYFSVQAVNAAGLESESRLVDVAVPSHGQGEEGARPFSIARVGFANGQATTMTLAFEAGDTETDLTVCAGDEPADAADEWAYSAPLGMVRAEAQELTFDLPKNVGGDVYRFVRIVAENSQPYDHLVDSVVSAAGTRYIDSGVLVNADNYARFRMKFTYSPMVPGLWNVFGYSGPHGRFFAGVSEFSSYAYGAFSGTQQTDTGVAHRYGDVVTVDLDVDGKRFSVTDETTGGVKVSAPFAPSAPSANLPMWMLGWSGYPITTRACALYAAEYWLDGECVRKFRPCVDRQGVACLYDEVTKGLFHSGGSGDELAAGAAIPGSFRVYEKLVAASAPDGCPVVATATVTPDVVLGNVVAVRGVISAFGAASAADCTLSLVLRADGVDEVLLRLGSPNADGTFSFDVDVDVVPGVTYDWWVVAEAASGLDNFQGDSFRIAAETKIRSVDATFEGRRVNVGVSVEEYGAGETELYLLWGETEATERGVRIGSFTVASNVFQRFSVDWPDMPRDGLAYYRVVASNFVGTVHAVGVEKTGSVVLKDTGTYTWKAGASGCWSDADNWTCNMDRNWGYPDSPDCCVCFPSGEAEVELDGSFTSKTVSWASQANVRFWGTNTNVCRYVCLGDGKKITLSSAATVTVERASLVLGTHSEILGLGQNARLHITRGADFKVQYLQTYEPGSQFRISDDAVATAIDYDLGSGDFIIDNALVVCREFFFVNMENGVYDRAHLLFRGKKPRLRWLAGATTWGESFANTSVTKEGVVEFDIPVGGYAETPILYVGTRTDYPFGSFDGYTRWQNRSTTLTIRIANRRGAFGGLPRFQPLVDWSSGIATNYIICTAPCSDSARFVYADGTDRPKKLGLAYKHAGMMLLVK